MCHQILTVLSLFILYLVATIHAKNEQSFECVDIHKQPSLQHPLLKNHKLQIITSPKQTRRSSLCPRGMVPIHKARNNFNNSLDAQDALAWATLDTKVGSNKYYGASATLSVNYLLPFVGKASRSLISIGSPQELNSMQFGWAVDPEYYGDYLTHFTVYWTSDGGNRTGCYDTMCKGFIQSSTNLYPGVILKPAVGGEEVVLRLYIVQDKDTGNWVLFNNKEIVGYWPKELFPNLGTGGVSLIRYGGKTVGGSQMGTGTFPDPGEDLNVSAYFEYMGFVDTKLVTKSIKELEMDINISRRDCYQLNYFQQQELITYGGAFCPN